MVVHGFGRSCVLAANQGSGSVGPTSAVDRERRFMGSNGSHMSGDLNVKGFEQRSNDGPSSDQACGQSRRGRTSSAQVSMSFAAHVHGEVLVGRSWAVREKAVVAGADVCVCDFDHQGLSSRVPFMEARCDSDHIRLLSLAPDAFTWAAQSHAFLDGLIIDAYAAWHPFQQGPNAWTMAGAKQGH